MKRIIPFMLFLPIVLHSYTQMSDSLYGYTSSSESLLLKNSKLTIGGYGEVHYNQDIDNKVIKNGNLDVHRMVMLFGYNFNEKTKFITEIEFEHVTEVYVEQAFLQHNINSFINMRAGLLLIPMGIINEYHEPTTFYGVERPGIDKRVTPTTWREIGFGFTGNIIPVSIKYQAYLMTGLNGYDGEANINGSGFRGGRQKGAESYISSPIVTGKVSHYGIRGLNIGTSLYHGSTQSTLFHNLDTKNDSALARADSSVLNISMIGVDARYKKAGFEFKGQLYYTVFGNTNKYNNFTKTEDGSLNDVANAMYGYYIEGGYNVFRSMAFTESKLIPFIRYERYDTQHIMDNGFSQSDVTDVTMVTAGISWFPASGAVLKADYQLKRHIGESSFHKTINAGVGVMF